MRRSRRWRLLLWAPAVALVLAGAARGAEPDAAARPASLHVFAAASLTEAFAALGKTLEERHPGLRITFNFAGSQQLATQLEHGAAADVFASADQRWMAYVQERGLLAESPRPFVQNRLVIILPRGNPGRITRPEDLARDGVTVVTAADAVPVGRYTRQALERLNGAPGFPADYARRVLRNVVSEEENVRLVVAKVLLGEADAGIVYSSDVTPAAAPRLRTLEIPDPYNIAATYPIAILKEAPNPHGARVFVDLVLSPAGQALLRDHNFIPVTPPERSRP